MRTNLRVNAAIAGVQALLRVGPIVVLAIGGQGLPQPDSFNDPAHALALIGSSPAVMIVAGLICATGVGQVFVVLALADRLKGSAPLWVSLSVAFGIISASFLMFDGAVGITALPQLAHMDVRQPMVDGAYLATLGVRNGIDRVIPLTLGIWALTAHIPAWQHRRLPRVLTATGLVLGAVGVLGVVLPAAGLASLILAIGWTAGFAIVLLRESGNPGTNGKGLAPSTPAINSLEGAGMIDDNLASVRNMEEDLFNHRDSTAVDRYVSPAYTLRTAEEGAPSGRDAVKAYIAAYLVGFPDLHISIDQLLAVGDKVVGVFTFTGTHKGDLFGVTPTGRTISVRQIAIYRLESGQVVDEWEISDQLGLMQQIGAHAGD